MSREYSLVCPNPVHVLFWLGEVKQAPSIQELEASEKFVQVSIPFPNPGVPTTPPDTDEFRKEIGRVYQHNPQVHNHRSIVC